MTAVEPEHLACERREAADAAARASDPWLEQSGSSWVAVDLTVYLAGDYEPVEPRLLHREDGPALLYAEAVNGLHGDSGIGKTWVAAFAAAEVLKTEPTPWHDHRVVWVDVEDNPSTLIGRLVALGVDPEAIRARLTYIRPTDPCTDTALEHLVGIVEATVAELVVIDSVGEAFALEGINEDRDNEVGPWFRRVARRLADCDAGPVVLLIDHATKAQDNALHPSGSKRKRAAITGASYLVEAPVPLTRERGGLLRLTVAKDRHGNWRRGAVAAELSLDTFPDGSLMAHLREPSGPTSADGAALTVIPKVLAALESAGDLSERALVAAVRAAGTKAGTSTIREAVDLATIVGCLEVVPGPRGARIHRYRRPFNPSADLTRLGADK